MNVRVREGAALPADAAAIEATLLQRRQDDAELGATRHAALARLSRLTGRPIADTDLLAIPQLAAPVAQARVDAGRRPAPGRSTNSSPAPESGWRGSRISPPPRISRAFRRSPASGMRGPASTSSATSSSCTASPACRCNGRRGTGARPTASARRSRFNSRSSPPTRPRSRKASAARPKRICAAIDRLTIALALDDRIVALREEIERSTQARFQERVRDRRRVSRSQHRAAPGAVCACRASRGARAGQREAPDDARTGGAVMRRAASIHGAGC